MSSERECPGHGCGAQLRDGFLCRKCQGKAERVLGDLPALAREVETTTAKLDRMGAGTRRSGPAPLPVNLTADERGRTVFELLFEWADHVAAWEGVTGLPAFARYRPLTELVPQAVAVLLRYSDWMRNTEQGPDLANAVHCVRRDLRQIIDRRPERAYAGPCRADLDYPPELGYDCRLKLFRQWGSEDIVCDGHDPDRINRRLWMSSGCGSIHASTDRTAWIRAEVEATLLPLRLLWEDIHELIPGCQVEWPTVKQWTRGRQQRIPLVDAKGRPRLDKRGRELVRIIVTPPRLEPQAWADDVPLYRGADVLRLAEDKPARRGRRRVRRAEVA